MSRTSAAVPRARFRPSVLAWVLSGLHVAGVCRAGNDDEFLVGNHAAVVGGAVVASVDDGSATYYNPAGVAMVERARVDIGGSVYALRFHHSDDFVRSAQGGRRDAKVREFVAVPTVVTFARRIVDGVTLGLGYFVPRGSNIVLRERLDQTDGALSAQYSVNTIQARSEFVLGAVVGVRATRWLRVGGGVHLTFEDSTDSVSLFGAVRSGGATLRASQADLLTTQTIVGIAPTGGAQIDLSDDVTLGVAARGPRLTLFNRGLARLDATLTSAAPAVTDANTVVSDIRGSPLDLVRVGRYTAGVLYRLDATQLSVEGDVQPALQDPAARVRREQAWNARAGFFHQATPRLGFGAGVFTDTENEAQDPDALFVTRGDFYGGTVGLRIGNEHLLAPGELASSLVFTTVFALKYAVSFGDSRSVVFDRDAAVGGLINGAHSTSSVHDVNFYVGSGLYF